MSIKPLLYIFYFLVVSGRRVNLVLVSISDVYKHLFTYLFSCNDLDLFIIYYLLDVFTWYILLSKSKTEPLFILPNFHLLKYSPSQYILPTYNFMSGNWWSYNNFVSLCTQSNHEPKILPDPFHAIVQAITLYSFPLQSSPKLKKQKSPTKSEGFF